MKKIFNTHTNLHNCPLFEGIETENLTKMLLCLRAEKVAVSKKQTIFSEGIKPTHIGILLAGNIQSIQVDYYGNRNILSVVSDNELFGEEFACSSINSLPVSYIANEKSEVMLIDREHILHTCSNNCAFHQKLIYNLMKSLANKNLSYHERIEITSKRTTREKLMSYLMLCARKANKNYFYIPFDRQSLADYLEVDRSGLSAEISKLRQEKIIESDKNYFKLL